MLLIPKVTVELPKTDKKLLSDCNISYNKHNNKMLIEVKGYDNNVNQLFNAYYSKRTNKIHTLKKLMLHTKLVKRITISAMWGADGTERTAKAYIQNFKEWVEKTNIKYFDVKFEDHPDEMWPSLNITLPFNEKDIVYFFNEYGNSYNIYSIKDLVKSDQNTAKYC